MSYLPDKNRYENKESFSRCGHSGLKLPRVALGLWHNFGDHDSRERARELLLGAFDRGITHFDLANNYGPPQGAAERCFGSILQSDLVQWRDELIISTKAGYWMWDGPYGDGGSRKYLLASLDRSLKRMGLDYVDIFYHHRPDLETPLEETMQALADTVRSGKALYVGISNYDAEQTRAAVGMLSQLGVPCLVNQFRYNMLDRRAEQGLLDTLEELGVGGIAFSPLAQGLLSDRYLRELPDDARAVRDGRFLHTSDVTPALLEKLRKLGRIAEARGQSIAQLALAWLLSRKSVTSVLVGASRLTQLENNLGAVRNIRFDEEERVAIDAILVG